MFERRRPATPAEIGDLIASFDVIDPPAVLYDAAVSDIATLDELRAAFTVLEATQVPPSSARRFYTLGECEATWAAGGGSAHDQQSYRRALQQADDPTFAPEVLFAPTTLVSTGWWIVDANHRAAALLTKRTATGVTSGLRVYVLPRPL